MKETASEAFYAIYPEAEREYYVAIADSPRGLEDEVRRKLSGEGWELQGGVSVCAMPAPQRPENIWYTYAQAMVRRTAHREDE